MINERLAELGYDYTPADVPEGSATIPAARSGNIVYTSGQIPMHDGELIVGKVGDELTIEDAAKAAEICAFNALRAIGTVAPIESIQRVLKVTGLVNVGDDFNDTTTVINGATDLLMAVLGERGPHPRTAVGARLPYDIAVELEMVVEVA